MVAGPAPAEDQGTERPLLCGPFLGSAVKHEINMNRLSDMTQGHVSPLVWSAEFDMDDFGAIGFESACPALQASLWREAAYPAGGAAESESP